LKLPHAFSGITIKRPIYGNGMAWRHAHRRWALRPIPSSREVSQVAKNGDAAALLASRTPFLLAQNGLEPHAVGVPRPLVDAYAVVIAAFALTL